MGSLNALYMENSISGDFPGICVSPCDLWFAQVTIFLQKCLNTFGFSHTSVRCQKGVMAASFPPLRIIFRKVLQIMTPFLSKWVKGMLLTRQHEKMSGKEMIPLLLLDSLNGQ